MAQLSTCVTQGVSDVEIPVCVSRDEISPVNLLLTCLSGANVYVEMYVACGSL